VVLPEGATNIKVSYFYLHTFEKILNNFVFLKAELPFEVDEEY